MENAEIDASTIQKAQNNEGTTANVDNSESMPKAGLKRSASNLDDGRIDDDMKPSAKGMEVKIEAANEESEIPDDSSRKKVKINWKKPVVSAKPVVLGIPVCNDCEYHKFPDRWKVTTQTETEIERKSYLPFLIFVFLFAYSYSCRTCQNVRYRRTIYFFDLSGNNY
jgi:hypothetical protein